MLGKILLNSCEKTVKKILVYFIYMKIFRLHLLRFFEKFHPLHDFKNFGKLNLFKIYSSNELKLNFFVILFRAIRGETLQLK